MARRFGTGSAGAGGNGGGGNGGGGNGGGGNGGGGNGGGGNGGGGNGGGGHRTSTVKYTAPTVTTPTVTAPTVTAPTVTAPTVTAPTSTSTAVRASQQTLSNTFGITTYNVDGSVSTVPHTSTPTPQGVTITGSSEGAKITFLTSPQMPAQSQLSQPEYNTLITKYGKDTADKLATQTYLTRGELRAQYPQLAGSDEPLFLQSTPSTPTPPIPTFAGMHTTPTPTPPSKPPTYTVSTSPKPSFSPLSIFPIVLVAVVLIGVLLFLRRRA